MVGPAAPFAVVSVTTADSDGVGEPVAVGVGDVGVGETSVVPPPQAASESAAATRVSGRARNLSLLTLRGYGGRRAGSRGAAGD